MSASSNDKLQVYLKIIEYKRSIGTTQWTVLSIFITASGAVFVFGLRESDYLSGHLLRIFAVMVYWLGYFLYKRYRQFNRQVSRYLVKLEEDIGLSFQKHLEKEFHANKGFSTKSLLLFAGVLYTVFVFSLTLFFI